MKTTRVRIIAALGLFALAGCSPIYKVDGVLLQTVDTGGDILLPGGEGTTTDIDVYPGLKIFHMDDSLDASVVTTQETLGALKTDNRYHIKGPQSVATSNLSGSGFVDASFVYFDEPFDGEFKISARVRMTAIASLSTSKGIEIGAFAPNTPPNAEGQVFTVLSKAAGMLFRTSTGSSNPRGMIRLYHATSTGWSATGLEYSATWKEEYIFEVSRTADGYEFSLKNSKTEAEVGTGTIADTAVHSSLAFGQPVFAGFSLLGSSAEISQIRIWDNAEGADDPVFETPDSTPGYVPVESLKIRVGSITNLPPDHGTQPNTAVYSASLGAVSGGITLYPVFTPTWADNTRVEWITLSCEPAGAITITGNEPRVGGVTTYTSGTVTATGAGRAVFLAVSRDLDLDNFDPASPPADYALKQTLAEYAIEIIITQ